ncbi:hypothetical protein BZA77DRAFT_340906 [Pyronema omphalodes]|nr:hypothetical protein BZA77DRAFT_340906 [Pyronema omphalodes]
MILAAEGCRLVSPSTHYHKDAQGNVFTTDQDLPIDENYTTCNNISPNARINDWIKVIDLRKYIIDAPMHSSSQWNFVHPCFPGNNNINQQYAVENEKIMATKMKYPQDKNIQEILDLKQWIACWAYTEELKTVRAKRQILERDFEEEDGRGKGFGFDYQTPSSWWERCAIVANHSVAVS